MDHPCYKCGHNIEEGKAFCAQCGAPQIRVVVADAPSLAPLAEGSPAPLLPLEAEPSSLAAPSVLLSADWSQTLRPCALAAGISAVPMFFGLNPFVAALGAGFLAVTFSQRARAIAIRPGTGAKFGALSGILLFGMSTTLELLAIAVLHRGAEIKSAMIEKVQQAAVRYPGPEIQPLLDFVKSPSGFSIMLVASLVFGLVAFVVLGSCGGALGATFLRRRGRP